MADETTAGPPAETTPDGGTPATLASGGDAGTTDAVKAPEVKSGEPGREPGKPPADPGTFNLVMPEGSGYGEAEKTQFVALAKDLGLNETQTQQLVAASAAARSAELDAQRAARNRQVEAWNRQLKSDKDFGGEGFSANVQYFLAGVKHVDADGELAKLLEDTGYGSHPAVVKALAHIGRMLDEDTIIGRGATADDKALAERYYKN